MFPSIGLLPGGKFLDNPIRLPSGHICYLCLCFLDFQFWLLPGSVWFSLPGLWFCTYAPFGLTTWFLIFACFVGLCSGSALIIETCHFQVAPESAHGSSVLYSDTIIDFIGFSHLVDLPTHYCNHNLDLVLMYGTEISHLATMPHNPLLSDHYPVTFNFPLPCNLRLKIFFFSFLDHIVGSMKTPLSELLNLVWLKRIHSDSIEFTLRKTLRAVAPLRGKKILYKKLAPWYNDHTRALKQALRKLERKWFST